MSAQSVVLQSAQNVVQQSAQLRVQSAQNVVQQNVRLHVLNVVHSISQRAQSVQPLVHSISQLAPSVLLHVHSISQRAIFQSRHVIVAQRLVEIANHILSLKHAGVMLQKISVQMILISRQTWQMLISLIQRQEMRLRNLSVILVFRLP
jgi:hypothetical protein